MAGVQDPRFGSDPGRMRHAIRILSRTVPLGQVPFMRGQAISFASVAVATLLRLALDAVIIGAPYVTFFPAVLIASVWGGTRAGITALVLASVTTSYFWLDPPGSPSFDANAIWTAASFAVFGGVLLVVAAMLRELVVALRRSERDARVLAGEMEHRIENLAATATALARQTARSATSTAEHVELFEARMAALGHARKLALGQPGGDAEMRPLLEIVLAPFGTARFDLVGPAARVSGALATVLALTLHELATNALKHGALSRPAGRVGLRWARCNGRIELNWTETGGPAVSEPTRRGFGTRLIRGALASHGAETELLFTPEGVRCRIAFPEPARPHTAPAEAGSAPLLPANGRSR